VLIDESGGIIAGHGRVMAARKLGMAEVPCITLAGLTETQRRAYVIADNRLAELAGWDSQMLALEMEDLRLDGYDLNLTGFDMGKIDEMFEQPEENGGGDDKGEKGINYEENYAILVACQDAAHQEQVYNELAERGYQCKVLVN